MNTSLYLKLQDVLHVFLTIPPLNILEKTKNSVLMFNYSRSDEFKDTPCLTQNEGKWSLNDAKDFQNESKDLQNEGQGFQNEAKCTPKAKKNAR